MAKVERQISRNKRTIDQLDSSTIRMSVSSSRASRGFGGLSKSIAGATRGASGLTTALFSVAGAYAAIEGAKKVFESTVLEAAKFEQSSVMITAMFDDKVASKAYMEMVDRIALDSPVLDSQAMYANSKGFMTTSKDLKQLEKMWDLAERMAAIDPMQGVEGSAFALKELFSGDAVSMVERFEMPRSIMNDIKELPLEEQLTALDKYFNKIGMTGKLINEMGDTTLGKWSQVKEKWNIIMREMGKPALEPLVGFFDDLLARFDSEDFARFGRIGGRIIENVISGLTSAAIGIYDWFTALSNSAQWKEASPSMKVLFVIEDIFAKFQSWFNETGRDQLERGAEELITILAGGITLAQDTIVETAKGVGIAVGKALVSGVKEELEESFNKNFLNSYIGKMTPGGWGLNIGNQIKDAFNGDKGKAKSKTKVGQRPTSSYGGGNSGYQKSHNGGLGYVPYNGYAALLHKGERVLTRGEADAFRASKTGGGNTFSFGDIHLHGVAGDLEAAAEKLLSVMADKIEASGGAGAYNGG